MDEPPPTPSLTFTKEVSPTQIAIGESATYTLTAENSEESPEVGCKVTDPNLEFEEIFTLLPGGKYTHSQTKKFLSPLPSSWCTAEGDNFLCKNIAELVCDPGVMKIASVELLVTTEKPPAPTETKPRSRGYWKNWNTCTGGNQSSKGIYLFDDCLPQRVGKLDMVVGEDGCEIAVKVLDMRDVANDKKMAADASYVLAAEFLTAQCNSLLAKMFCPAAGEAFMRAQKLLVDLEFKGEGEYLSPKDPRYKNAQEITKTLKKFNSGTLCK